MLFQLGWPKAQPKVGYTPDLEHLVSGARQSRRVETTNLVEQRRLGRGEAVMEERGATRGCGEGEAAMRWGETRENVKPHHRQAHRLPP